LPEIIPDILATLAYFDLFDFPLTGQELYSYLPGTPGYTAFAVSLNHMLRQELIFCSEGFYLLRQEPGLVSRRREGEKKAAGMLETAGRIGRWLGRFPFVRGVAVSGSLRNILPMSIPISISLLSQRPTGCGSHVPFYTW